MALEHSEVQAIKKEILDEADKRYVKIESCIEKQETVNNKLSKDDKRIELLIHDFKVIKWLITTVAVSSIGALVVSFFELILK
jgi:phosphatidate phosphatase PAH1